MSGAVNADFVKANITTRKNASILASTATSGAAIEAPNVVEEGEKIGNTTNLVKPLLNYPRSEIKIPAVANRLSMALDKCKHIRK